MKKLKTKKIFWRKIIFIFIFVFTSTFAPIHQANAWLSIPAAIIGDVMDWLYENIEGIIVGMIKQAGAMAINKMMSNLVGGGASGNAMFITDWQDYLLEQPKQNTASYMNDYLTQMTQGRGSVSLYIPTPAFEGVGVGAFNVGVSAYGNYSSRLNNIGKQRIASRTRRAAPRMTYSGNPSNMFDQLNFKQLDIYLYGVNNPWAFDRAVDSEQMLSLEEERDLYMAKAIANQGFKGQEVNGQTITPGSLVKDKMSGVENIGNQILATASDIGMVMTAVITSLVTKSIENGIGNIQAKIQKEVLSVQNKTGVQMNLEIDTIGPAAIYKPQF